MTARDDIDRHLTAWLTETANVHEPEELLGKVLARTARTRRRPAWLIPERWTLLSAISNNATALSRMSWRTVGALALVALLTLAVFLGAVLIAGSRSNAIPAPFGPAANGLIAYSKDGDIVAVDRPGAAVRTLIAGATKDSGPVFSPDGRQFVFLRAVSDSSTDVWVAAADGSGPRRLAGPYGGLDWVEWSPQADVVAILDTSDPGVITMQPADGATASVIRTGLAAVQNVVFRPSDGRQLALRGQDASGTWGIYLVDRDGSNLGRLGLDPGFETDDYYAVNSEYYFQAPAWSPDGSRLMYTTLGPDPSSPAGPGFRIHIAELDATGGVIDENRLEFDRGADDEFGAVWLPTGDGIVFDSLEGSTHHLAVAAADGSGPARALGLEADEWIFPAISPDGRQLMSTSSSTGTSTPVVQVTDLAAATSTTLDVSDDFAWQRQAP